MVFTASYVLSEPPKDKLWSEIDPDNSDELIKWKADKVFVFLQMLTSAMVCFARGTNDVSHGMRFTLF